MKIIITNNVVATGGIKATKGQTKEVPGEIPQDVADLWVAIGAAAVVAETPAKKAK